MKSTNLLLNLLILFVSLLIGLALCEGALILADWSPQKSTSDYLQFGYSTGVPIWDEDGVLEEGRPVKVKLFQQDKELFWKPIPNTQFTNNQGFRGKQDIQIENSSHAVRVLVLGDSCSFLGKKLYVDFLSEHLAKNYPNDRFEIINASVPGYTSFQGKKALESLLPYKPDFAVIYFGWNDHWILPSGYSDDFHSELLHSLKVVQLAKIMWARITDMREYRVPLDDYEANLRTMVQELQDHDIVPVLIAAPAGYGQQGMPAWALQFYQQYYRMTPAEINGIPETHKAYADVVRQVAKETKAVLVNAQKHFEEKPAPLRTFFRSDLIHLTSKGHEVLAEQLYNQLTGYDFSSK